MQTTLVRRSIAVAASVAATGALTLLPQAGAQAAVKGTFQAGGSSDVTYTGTTPSGVCALTSAAGSDSATSSTATFSHGTKHRSVDISSTYTSPDDATDKVHVKGHVDASSTIRRQGKDLKSYDLAAGGTIKITHTQVTSHCQGSVELGGIAQPVLFTEHKAGWFTLTRDTGKQHQAITEFELVNVDTNKVIQLDVFQGTLSHQVSRVKLKPGDYGFLAAAVIDQGNFNIGIGLKSQQRVVRAKPTVTLHADFKRLKKK
jgi:hypothetical protein